MTLTDPRVLERKVDELRTEQNRILSLPADDPTPPQDRRDTVMRLAGEISALESQAREYRDFELEQARAVVEGGAPLGEAGEHAEQMDAFRGFLRTGDVQNAALLTTPDANGGYLMPYPMRESLIDVVRKINPIMDNATIFRLSKPGTFKVELPRKTGKTAGGWVGETDARPATAAPTFGRQTLECFEWYANPEVTQTALDAIEGIEDVVVSDIADTFSEVTGTAFANGTGTTQPDGVFGTAAQSFYTTKLSSTAASLDALQLLGSYFALPAKYLPTAAWFGNGATFAALSALAWPNLVDTPLVRWENGKPTIMGKECTIVDDAPAMGAAAFPLAFGDMRRGYAIGLHSSVQSLRDPFTNKPYVSFYTTGRAGGVPWDPNALLLLKSNNS